MTGPPTDVVVELDARATRSAAGDKVPFVLVEAPGEVTPGHEVDDERAARRGRGGARVIKNRIAVLHGVNLDQLGVRDPAIYGSQTLTELEVQVKRWAQEIGLETQFDQTNHEGEFCETLHGRARPPTG